MKDFKEVYTSEAEKEKPENKNKVVLTNEAYAIGGLLQAIKDLLDKGISNHG